MRLPHSPLLTKEIIVFHHLSLLPFPLLTATNEKNMIIYQLTLLNFRIFIFHFFTAHPRIRILNSNQMQQYTDLIMASWRLHWFSVYGVCTMVLMICKANGIYLLKGSVTQCLMKCTPMWIWNVDHHIVASTVASADFRPGAFLCAVCTFSLCQFLSRFYTNTEKTNSFTLLDFNLVVGVIVNGCIFKASNYLPTCLVSDGSPECKRSANREWISNHVLWFFKFRCQG